VSLLFFKCNHDDDLVSSQALKSVFVSVTYKECQLQMQVCLFRVGQMIPCMLHLPPLEGSCTIVSSSSWCSFLIWTTDCFCNSSMGWSHLTQRSAFTCAGCSWLLSSSVVATRLQVVVLIWPAINLSSQHQESDRAGQNCQQITCINHLNGTAWTTKHIIDTSNSLMPPSLRRAFRSSLLHVPAQRIRVCLSMAENWSDLILT